MDRFTRRLATTLSLIALLAATFATPASAVPTLCDPTSQTCRKFTIENNCTQDLLIGTLGNVVGCTASADCPTATSTCSSSSCTCMSDGDCASTQVCDPTQNVCRFRAPLAGGAAIAAGTAQTIYLPNQNYNQAVSWAGRFWARTGCPDFDSCSPAGQTCSSPTDCCTNAGCTGLNTCTTSAECPAISCSSDMDCPTGVTCDTGTMLCNSCLGSGQCACNGSTVCPDGGQCVNGACTGTCESGGIACQTGDCQADERCGVGVSGQGPMTLAEFALLAGATNFDTYDVSQVNGFNVPIKITPKTNVRSTPKAGASQITPWCASPGCASKHDPECKSLKGACSWTDDFASCLCDWSLNDDSCPDPLQAVWPFACSSDADCGGGTCDLSTVPATCICARDEQCPGSTTCGVNLNVRGKRRVCGTYVGCLDADDTCTADKRLKGKFDGLRFSCKRFEDVYDCTNASAGSCYTLGASAECCGCPSWSSGGNLGPFPITAGCQNSNPRWTRVVEPLAKAFKGTCPTAYSFQYDDPTSTFNCAGAGPKSPVGYSITFCPNGSPGAAS